MERNLSQGARGTPAVPADETRSDRLEAQERRQRRLLEFLTWRSFGVRFALSRAKRRAHGRKPGPIRSIAVL